MNTPGERIAGTVMMTIFAAVLVAQVIDLFQRRWKGEK